VLSFTGSIETSERAAQPPGCLAHAVRFIASGFAQCRGARSRCWAETRKFDLFVKEVVREMTVKSGQKCTAIRRILVPAGDRGQGPRGARRATRAVTVGRSAPREGDDGPLVD